MDKNYNRKTFAIFWRHLARRQPSFWLALSGAILGSGSFILGPFFYKDFFDALASGNDSVATGVILFSILGKLLIVYFFGWLGWRIATFAASHFQSWVAADIYNTCFAYLHRHSVSFFNNNFVGSLVKRVNRFPAAFISLTDMFLWEFMPLLVNAVFISVVLFLHSWLLGAAVVLWMIVFALINYFFSRYKLKYDLERNKADTRVTGVLADTITNHQNIKFFSAYGRERKYFAEAISDWRRLRKFTWDISQAFEAVQGVLIIGLELGIFYLMIRFWQKGSVTIGDFVLVQAYLITIFDRFWNLGRLIRRYYENVADAAEMTEILEKPHEIIEVKTAEPLSVKKGEIVFNDVTFAYNQTRQILSHFNLKIAAHEKVGLVGPSGAGKSTIINLLLRNFDLENGAILIDGQKINRATLNSLWAAVSLVPQDSILFHRTLLENIRYGRPEASDEEVFAAAKLANCHDFISAFPDGYQTFVGERGVKLSGGERQRVAIARAILKNAPILILDEATSSLDSESERLIQEALSRLMADKTVIVVAHRLSTIMQMDRIVVLDKGKIVEEGSHSFLFKKKDGLYAKLWQRQAIGFLE